MSFISRIFNLQKVDTFVPLVAFSYLLFESSTIFSVSTFRVQYKSLTLSARKCRAIVVLSAKKGNFVTETSAKKCRDITKIPAKKCNDIYGKNCISKTYRMER